MEILAVIVGVETLVLIAFLLASAVDHRARAAAWRQIASARRCANCPTCRAR